jgi:ketosteroid isomerase-like protein
MTGHDGPHVRTVRALLDAIGRQHEEDLGSLLAEDVQWWFPPSVAAGRLRRPVTGRSGVVRAVIPERPAFRAGSTTWHVHHIVAQGDLVAVHVDRECKTRGGSPYRVEYHFLVRMSAGKVAEVWDIMDTKAAAEQVDP